MPEPVDPSVWRETGAPLVAGPPRWAAHRAAGRGEGPVRARGPADGRRGAGLPGRRPAGAPDRERGDRAARRRRRRRRHRAHRRVRVQHRRRQPALRHPAERRGARRPARRLLERSRLARWGSARRTSASGPTPAGPSGCPPRTRGSGGCGRRTARVPARRAAAARADLRHRRLADPRRGHAAGAGRRTRPVVDGEDRPAAPALAVDPTALAALDPPVQAAVADLLARLAAAGRPVEEVDLGDLERALGGLPRRAGLRGVAGARRVAHRASWRRLRRRRRALPGRGSGLGGARRPRPGMCSAAPATARGLLGARTLLLPSSATPRAVHRRARRGDRPRADGDAAPHGGRGRRGAPAAARRC